MEFPKDMLYKRYTVIGFAEKDQMGNMRESAEIEVFAENEQEALQKAQTMVKKLNYVVRHAGEYILDQRLLGKE